MTGKREGTLGGSEMVLDRWFHNKGPCHPRDPKKRVYHKTSRP